MAATDVLDVNQQQQQNTAQTGQTGQTGTAGNQNTYTAGQSGLQGTLGQSFANMLNGNIPSQYTNNPTLAAATTTAYNQNVAPGEAFQGGAGNPAIASNLALSLQQQMANQYNTGVSQFQNANTLGANYALGLPTGSNQQTNNTGTSNTNTATSGTSASQNSSPLTLINELLATLGGP